MLLGRLQRRVEQEGHLSFDFPVSEPLQIFLRLSPRLDEPEQGLRVVRASTMSLVKNLRELNVEQRQLTTLRYHGEKLDACVGWSKKVP